MLLPMTDGFHLVTWVEQMSIKEIAIFCDHKHDESYTPSKLSIRAGTHFHDLQVISDRFLIRRCIIMFELAGSERGDPRRTKRMDHHSAPT